MSVKTPSLFDDFFFEEEKKEELFPDVPHVYDPEENKENLVEEEKIEESESEIEQSIEEDQEDSVFEEQEELEIKENIFAENTASIIVEEKENVQQYKMPSLELPEKKELDQQLFTEIISTDYASYIHKDYPFNPLEIEKVSIEKPDVQESLKVIEEEVADVIDQTRFAEEEIVNDIDQKETEEDIVTPLPDWDLSKKYYPIGEVAKLFDVNISHIRFWTNEFKLNPRTTRKGDRLYSPDQINELKLIHYLVKVKKHTIKGAIEKMKNQKETVGSNLKLKESLTELRDLLLEIQGSI